MLTRYIEGALGHSQYEWLEESQDFYGEIPELQGVWATGSTVDECRAELRDVLEEWIAMGLPMNHHIPVLSGVDVNVETVT